MKTNVPKCCKHCTHYMPGQKKCAIGLYLPVNKQKCARHERRKMRIPFIAAQGRRA